MITRRGIPPSAPSLGRHSVGLFLTGDGHASRFRAPSRTVIGLRRPSPLFILFLLLLFVAACAFGFTRFLASRVEPEMHGEIRLADWRPDISHCAPLIDNGTPNDFAACVGYR